jgi:hypothetical protein
MTAKDAPGKGVLDALQKAYGDFDCEPLRKETEPLERLLFMVLAVGQRRAEAQALIANLVPGRYVDWNEVRVTPAFELGRALAPSEGRTRDEAVGLARAAHVREFLATIFNRFNKVSLAFLHEGSTVPDAARKRERFLAWILEAHPALGTCLAAELTNKIDAAQQPAAQRVVQRLGWTRGKSGVAAVRAALDAHVGSARQGAVLWKLVQVSHAHCHARTPDCERCPVASECALGKKSVRPASKKEAAPRVRK